MCASPGVVSMSQQADKTIRRDSFLIRYTKTDNEEGETGKFLSGKKCLKVDSVEYSVGHT